MPEQLLGRIIKACSHSGELVLDPFGGSGTTLIVAKKLGRRFLGFELSENYAAQIRSRLAAVSAGDPLAGADEPKVSAPATRKGKRRADVTRTTSAPVLIRSEPADVNRGIVEAFFAARDGFPVDRVIADPDLNARFAEICGRLGLPGKPTHWNHRLMNLRKAGYFTGLPRSKVTTFPLEKAEFEKYKFACEIAMQKFQADGIPFDKVLCDPEMAAEFDAFARLMIPERLTSLKIRWFALRLRKGESKYRRDARALKAEDRVALPRDYENPFGMRRARVPASPGLYWLQGEGRRLYVGETPNLRERLEIQFSADRFGFWGVDKQKLELGHRCVDSADILRPNQSIWIAKWKPEGNLARLAVAL